MFKPVTIHPTPELFANTQLTFIEEFRKRQIGGKHAGALIRLWRCQCKCGKQVIVRPHAVKCGNTVSCGCVQRARIHRLFWS